MLGHLDAEQIEQLLSEEVVGRIGIYAEGRVYVVPVTYAYDGGYVYGHTTEGMKLRMMRLAPRVCFEVEHVETISSWRSVIAWGDFEELHGEPMMAALGVLMRRMMPLMTGAAMHPTHGLGPHLAHAREAAGPAACAFRIKLDEKTGRFEKPA